MNTKLSFLAAAFAAATALVVPVASSAHATTVPRCTNADLRVSLRGSDGAAGTIYHKLLLTNVSGHRCSTGGFGGVSFVGHGNGTQVGAAADRRGTATPLIVAPAGHIVSTLGVTEWGNYPRRRCQPVHADGYRVYVPNATHSQFLAVPQTVCGNPAVHLLSHTAYRHP
jgi:hypothetical protein